MVRITGIGLVVILLAAPVWAHHGFGRFEMDKIVEYSGTLTGIDLVNPHSYMNFDTEDSQGNPISMRCEMRAATLLKRSGWSIEMFVTGSQVNIQAHPHRNDPHSCYLENFTLGDAPEINRNDQFSKAEFADLSNRPDYLASGVPNISGDWAVEQLVLTIPPEGGNGALVPKSLRQAYAGGEITLEEIRQRNPRPSAPVYTEQGKAAAEAFRMWSVEDNPRLSCKPTSIIFDWTFDWPVNRITQKTVGGKKVIDMDYGLYSLFRRIHMEMDGHPEDIAPGYAGHSIGRWEANTLVVDTVGFEPGVLVPPTRNSEQLHIVERFTFNPEDNSIRREYTATDPVYLARPYTGTDIVYISETPYEKHPCKELTYEFINSEEKDRQE